MRTFILATAIVLVSGTAFAEPVTRGLSVASAEPKTMTEKLKAAGIEPVQEVAVETTTAAAKTTPAATRSVEPQAPGVSTTAGAEHEIHPKSESRAESRKPPKARPVVKKRESDEQKARRIAARFGISW